MSTCGTPKPAAVFHSVEKSLTVSLCRTLCNVCMDSAHVLQKPEKQNPRGASAPPFTCLQGRGGLGFKTVACNFQWPFLVMNFLKISHLSRQKQQS